MEKVLIANRGEIALRIMRSLKEMGISTVAVYSEADRIAPFVLYADEAVEIGPPPSSESYLLGDKIIEVGKALGVDGIHPGYGFLSENADFASAVLDAGITFIGPSAHAMELMGDKLSAKAAVKDFDIPMIPGTDTAVEDPQEAIAIAKKIGFPILIKASAGGGGKGMRVVEKEDELEENMQLARNEAISSFGNGAVFIERYVGSPRHIEIQILADTHGNYVHLFERECSVQRRHQKVIEEAPSSVLAEEMRVRMGKAALDVARACEYVGAGTVEFLLDENNEFFFLEMNTRLQVEHPVTEMITGIDLVKEQIRIARGEKLSFEQSDLKIHGHAIEVRVYAEDPTNNFLPDIGTLTTYKRPQGPGVRVDDAFDEGMDVPVFYDPMIAKLVVHADDREQAMDRMIRAIDEYKINGVATTLPLGRFVMKHEAFRKGTFDTHFIRDHFTVEKMNAENEEEMRMASTVAALAFEKGRSTSVAEQSSGRLSKWRQNRSGLT